MESTTIPDTAGHDWVDGAAGIGLYMFPDIEDPQARRRKVYHLIEKGLLPVLKLGGRFRARRSRLRRLIEEGENAALSADA